MKTLKNNLREIWFQHNLENSEDLIIGTNYKSGEACSYILSTDLTSMYRILKIKLNPGECNFQQTIEEFGGVNVGFVNNEMTFILKREDLIEIFELLCDDLIEETASLITIQEVYERTVEITRKWRSLFSQLGKEGLSPERQKGLFGELIFIQKQVEMNYNFNEILKGWKGPDYGDKDFRYPNLFAEVKFTTTSIPSIKISSENQLSSQPLDPIFVLVNIKAEKTIGSNLSLISIIESLSADFKKQSDQAYRLFHELLEKYGYLEIHNKYYKQEYKIKSINYYQIKEDFPRITEGNISNGLHKVTYHIENAAIIDFQINEDSVFKILSNGESI